MQTRHKAMNKRFINLPFFYYGVELVASTPRHVLYGHSIFENDESYGWNQPSVVFTPPVSDEYLAMFNR